jgi:hypothetical protein
MFRESLYEGHGRFVRCLHTTFVNLELHKTLARSL